ncbi:hypothetical protein [Cellulophaga sp. L1A9]|uniref:hypothetical protein n=1 Tax=Cellulophaga sp. L1A9 TaxID=2686362 RepID=UPI00131D9C6C|nr:hypothetical protein [Cellulophaga sp. L1A9]
MKKIIFIFILIAYAPLKAQNIDWEKSCYKIENGSNDSQHCLLEASQRAEHLFNVLPKLIIYKYDLTSNEYIQKDFQNKKLYKAYSNSIVRHEAYELRIEIPTYKEHVRMIVFLTDLDLLDIVMQEYTNADRQDLEKLLVENGTPLPAATAQMQYKPQREFYLNTHSEMYERVKEVSIDYSAELQGGALVPQLNLPNYEKPFITYTNLQHEIYFEATYADKYLFKIEMKGVESIHSCTTALAYIEEYLMSVDFSELDRSFYFKAAAQ